MVYRGTEAYDFSLFEPKIVEQPGKKNNTKGYSQQANAPVRKPAPSRKTIQKQSNVVKLINEHQYEVERNSQNAVVPSVIKKIMCFSVVCFAMVVVLLIMQSKCDTLMNEIASVQSEMKIAEGENVRLNAELSTLVASDKIENYAENVLGMVKAESYQISYIDLSEGDEIVVSGDKTINNDENIKGKIKSLFAYIF